jgi:predicted TIM-barrel fold metal-dependent hydrolase
VRIRVEQFETMIIDAYNNVWEAQEDGGSAYLTGRSFSFDTIVEDMDEAGVDKAVACSLGQDIDNDYIRNGIRRYPDRIIGFGQVNPRDEDAAEQARVCFEEYDFDGLKLHPTMHGYHFADHDLLDPVFEILADYGAIAIVNALDDQFVSPLRIEEIAKDHPDVPVLIAHMGTVWDVTEAILVANRTDNIYLETSVATTLDVGMAYEDVGPEKIIMGTDWPADRFELERRKIEHAIPDEDDRRLVEGENLARLLGIDA